MACVAASELGLPTLLSPTPQAPEPAKKHRLRPTPPALEMPAVEACEMRVKNTFVDVDVPPPLSATYAERALRTCPSERIGRLLLDAMLLEDGLLSTPRRPDSPQSVLDADPLWAGGAGEQGVVPQQQQHQHFAPLMWRQSPRKDASEPSKLTLQLADMVAGPAWEAPAPVQALQFVEATGALAPPSSSPLTPPPAEPAPGSEELPSLGSAGHADGSCKPCAFVHAGRCTSGPACRFCHLCGPEERKRRRREKLDAVRANRELRRVDAARA